MRRTIFIVGLASMPVSAGAQPVADASEPPLVTEPAPLEPDLVTQPPKGSNEQDPPEPVTSNEDVPEGFEDLLQELVTFVDVFVGGKRVGVTEATVTPETLRFSDPTGVVDLIPGARDKPALIKALTETLSANGHLSCHPTPTTGCGKLEPKIAGVIYESDIFRVDVVVASAYLDVQSLGIQRFIPPPNAGFSSLANLTASVSGTNDRAGYALNLRSHTAYNENQLFMHLSQSDRGGFVAQSLRAERHVNRHKFQAGFFPLQDTSIVGGFETLGIGAVSSNRLRIDVTQGDGTPIQVFLPFRSRVNIYRERELLASGIYEPGNQVMDTRPLPIGAYFVRLEIEDARGEQREETRFFVKSNRLPPANEPSYWAALGALVTERDGYVTPFVSDNLVAGGGLGYRLSGPWAGVVDILASRRQGVLELGALHQFQQFEASTDLLATSDGFLGHALTVFGQYGRFNVAFNWRGVVATSSEIDPTDINQIELASVLGGGVGRFIERSSVQLGTRVGYRFNDGVVSNVFANWTAAERVQSRYSVGTDTTWYLARKGPFVVQLQGSLTANTEGFVGLLSLGFSDNDGSWNTGGAIGGQSIRSNGQFVGDKLSPAGHARLGWQDGDRYRDDLSWSLVGDYRSGTASQRADVRYGGPYGFGWATTSLSSDRLSYTLNGSSSFLFSEEGVTAGGKSNAESAIVLDIESSEPDLNFEVEINGARWGVVPSNQRVPIPLPAFRKYTVEVRPISQTIVTLDRDAQVGVLYPGTVSHMTWRIKRSVVMIGTLVNRFFEPLVNAHMHSEQEPTATDEEGFFQLTMGLLEEVEVETEGGGTCSFVAPDLEIVDNVIFADEPIVCR